MRGKEGGGGKRRRKEEEEERAGGEGRRGLEVGERGARRGVAMKRPIVPPFLCVTLVGYPITPPKLSS